MLFDAIVWRSKTTRMRLRERTFRSTNSTGGRPRCLSAAAFRRDIFRTRDAAEHQFFAPDIDQNDIKCIHRKCGCNRVRSAFRFFARRALYEPPNGNRQPDIDHQPAIRFGNFIDSDPAFVSRPWIRSKAARDRDRKTQCFTDRHTIPAKFDRNGRTLRGGWGYEHTLCAIFRYSVMEKDRSSSLKHTRMVEKAR